MVAVLKALEKSTARLYPYDFKSAMKGLLRVGTLEQGLEVMYTYLDSDIIKDAKTALSYIEPAIEAGGFDEAFEVLKKLRQRNIPFIDSFWETVIRSYLRKDGIVHASMCFKMIEYPLLDLYQLWDEFFDRAINCDFLDLAYNTVQELSLKTHKNSQNKWWNMLLKKVSANSYTTDKDVFKIIEQIQAFDIEADEDSLTFAFSKLIKSGEQAKIVSLVKDLKRNITPNVISNLISSLIDKNIAKEALETANLVVQGYFGDKISIEKLTLANEKLKWVVKEQQLQMMKFMKAMRKPDIESSEESEDEFIFL